MHWPKATVEVGVADVAEPGMHEPVIEGAAVVASLQTTGAAGMLAGSLGHAAREMNVRA